MNLSHAMQAARSPAGLAGAALALAAATAAWVHWRARRAERDNPPAGSLMDIDGVRLHWVEYGAEHAAAPGSPHDAKPPVVLIHGNLVSHRDFIASGLIDRLAARHRVIAFDRPGFGHSSRPRDREWTPEAQAALLHAACARLGVDRPVIVGHSMGAMVALAMGLQQPQAVRKLVLLSGYYYPTVRIDAWLAAPNALPVLGAVLRHTVTAVSARLLLATMVKAMFAPRQTPEDFMPVLGREMMVRPGQLGANAEDAAFMRRQARSASEHHRQVQLPVAIFAGDHDLVVDVQAHAARLHDELPHSTLAVIAGAGHMVHYAAVEQIAAAVEADRDAALADRRPADRARLLQDAAVPHAAAT